MFNKIDLVILDINSKITKGANRLKKNNEFNIYDSDHHVHSVLDDYNKEGVVKMGAHEFWVKPVKNATLEAKVDYILADLTRRSMASNVAELSME